MEKLYMDHNHETGKVRSLLCVNYNTALGKVKEDINLLYKMIDYLNEHSAHASFLQAYGAMYAS